MTKDMWLAKKYIAGGGPVNMGFLRDTLHPILFQKDEETGYSKYISFFQTGPYTSFHELSCPNDSIIETEKDVDISILEIDKKFNWKEAIDVVKENGRVACEFNKLSVFKKAINDVSKLHDNYPLQSALMGATNRKMLRKHLTFAIMINKLEDVCAIYNRNKVDGLGISVYVLDKEHTILSEFPTLVYSTHMYVSNHEANVFTVDGVEIRKSFPFSVPHVLKSIDSVIHTGKALELEEPKLGGSYRGEVPSYKSYKDKLNPLPSRRPISKYNNMRVDILNYCDDRGHSVATADDGHKIVTLSLPRDVYSKLNITTDVLYDFFGEKLGIKKHTKMGTVKLKEYLAVKGIETTTKLLTKGKDASLQRSAGLLYPPSDSKSYSSRFKMEMSDMVELPKDPKDPPMPAPPMPAPPMPASPPPAPVQAYDGVGFKQGEVTMKVGKPRKKSSKKKDYYTYGNTPGSTTAFSSQAFNGTSQWVTSMDGNDGKIAVDIESLKGTDLAKAEEFISKLNLKASSVTENNE
jgi:hypothetical protein